MKNLSPKQEPVGWSVIVGLAIAAAASYGLGVTDELREFLVVVVPMMIAGWIARRSVTPSAKADAKIAAARRVGAATGASRDAAG